jgi:hypothetical protein
MPFAISLVKNSVNPQQQIAFDARIDGSTLHSVAITSDIPFGEIVQLSCRSGANGKVLRLRSATVDRSVSMASNVPSTMNFSAVRPVFGAGGGGAVLSNVAAMTKVRFYRGFVENLGVTLRNADVVLNEDWERTMGREVYI